jgi:hypothetical protein
MKISTITKLFPGADKLLLHVPAGAVAALITLIFTNDPYELIRSAAEIGLMKEVWDYARNKTIKLENWMDFFATALGGVLVAVWYF